MRGVLESRPSEGRLLAYAFLAAGIGAFAVGLFVLLNEMGLFAAPALYEPAGGVSGRTTFAVVAWLVVVAVTGYDSRMTCSVASPTSTPTR